MKQLKVKFQPKFHSLTFFNSLIIPVEILHKFFNKKQFDLIRVLNGKIFLKKFIIFKLIQVHLLILRDYMRNNLI